MHMYTYVCTYVYVHKTHTYVLGDNSAEIRWGLQQTRLHNVHQPSVCILFTHSLLFTHTYMHDTLNIHKKCTYVNARMTMTMSVVVPTHTPA